MHLLTITPHVTSANITYKDDCLNAKIMHSILAKHQLYNQLTNAIGYSAATYF